MSGKKRYLLILGIVVGLMLPIVAIAADRFNDVPDTDPFHDDIGWLANAGVTAGCNPPANDEFCPEDPVKRKQMAAFMRRFAAYLGAEDGVVSEADNAGTLDGLDSTDLVAKGEPDSVDASMIVDEAGVAMGRDETFGSIASGSIVTVTSATIDAPADGFVIVTVSGQIRFVHTNGTASEVEIAPSAAAGVFDVGEEADYTVPASGASDTYQMGYSQTRSYAVSAGMNTFYLSAEQQSGLPELFENVITVTYVPTAYGTLDPLSVPAGASADEELR